MKKNLAALVFIVLVLGFGRDAFATPTTHIWGPSTDVQAFGVVHLTADLYLPAQGNDELADGTDATMWDRPDPMTNLGLTLGIIPSDKIQMEVGFDHITGMGFYEPGDMDDAPMYFNAKLGIPEAAFGKYSPAFAMGGYLFGTDDNGEARVGHMYEPGTDFNVVYAKLAKTIGPLGRFSVGYYTGNKKLLVDEMGDEDEDGVMAAWERTMGEISENLWLCVEYMDGESSMGALSYGFSWKFAPNASVIFAYIDQNNDELAFVEDWVSVQVDIDWDLFSGSKKK